MEKIVGARVRVDIADMYLGRQGAEGGGMSDFLRCAKALTTQARETALAKLLARA